MIPFRPLFSKPVYRRALVLVVGAILAVRARTVAAVLRVMGLGSEKRFCAYHRVLSRARWSQREAARQLLGALVERFAPAGPLVFGIDDTIERRRGARIEAKGIYRDPVRSSKGHFVKASGLRWLGLMLLAEIPWAKRVWALPFLTALCPSERYHTQRGRRHKKLNDFARQMIFQLRRWLPGRQLVVVADSSFAALDLLYAVRSCGVAMVTRLRLDASLYCPAPPRLPRQPGRPRKKGERLPKLEERLHAPATEWRPVKVSQWYGKTERQLEVATGTAVWYSPGKSAVPLRWVLVRDPDGTLEPKGFLCTDQQVSPTDILRWFVRRWSVEVTFEEVRRHLGVETQRQWSDLAILRATPCLLGLFSLVTLMADRSWQAGRPPVPRQSAWYAKVNPTFSDALAAVRIALWKQQQKKHFCRSGSPTETLKIPTTKIPTTLFERLIGTLAYTA
jgi:hypothetical protein